jgi:GDP-D-mannose dehydratase
MLTDMKIALITGINGHGSYLAEAANENAQCYVLTTFLSMNWLNTRNPVQ